MNKKLEIFTREVVLKVIQLFLFGICFWQEVVGKVRDKADVGWNNWKGKEKSWGWKSLKDNDKNGGKLLKLKLNESFLSFFLTQHFPQYNLVYANKNNVANKLNNITIHNAHNIQLGASTSQQISMKTFKIHFTEYENPNCTGDKTSFAFRSLKPPPMESRLYSFCNLKTSGAGWFFPAPMSSIRSPKHLPEHSPQPSFHRKFSPTSLKNICGIQKPGGLQEVFQMRL